MMTGSSGFSSSTSTLESALVRLERARRIAIITHQHPDGDGIGSSLALADALERRGKSVTLFCKDPVPVPFRFLADSDRFSDTLSIEDVDLVVVLDCGDLKRTGVGEMLRSVGGRRGMILNIDHHQRNDLQKLATLNVVSTEVSSTAELIYQLLKRLDAALITKRVATALLTGLYNDTGGFRHSNTSAEVLSIAATLLATGARLREITRHVASFRSVPALKLWGVALGRIRAHRRLSLVASVITQQDLARCDALYEDLAGAVNLINHVPDANVAILCSETPDGNVKASLRTESDHIDVAALARLFGGGGLRKAAGFSFPGRIVVDEANQWRIVPHDPSALPEHLGLMREMVGALTRTNVELRTR